MNHFISLNTAIQMTGLYRQEKENILANDERGKDILPVCETFDKDSVNAVLSQPGCVKLRIYYGMLSNADKKTHAILVGVNGRDEDMLPPSPTSPDNSNILEEAVRCPTNCPPPSVLNS